MPAFSYVISSLFKTIAAKPTAPHNVQNEIGFEATRRLSMPALAKEDWKRQRQDLPTFHFGSRMFHPSDHACSTLQGAEQDTRPSCPACTGTQPFSASRSWCSARDALDAQDFHAPVYHLDSPQDAKGRWLLTHQQCVQSCCFDTALCVDGVKVARPAPAPGAALERRAVLSPAALPCTHTARAALAPCLLRVQPLKMHAKCAKSAKKKKALKSISGPFLALKVSSNPLRCLPPSLILGVCTQTSVMIIKCTTPLPFIQTDQEIVKTAKLSNV